MKRKTKAKNPADKAGQEALTPAPEGNLSETFVLDGDFYYLLPPRSEEECDRVKSRILKSKRIDPLDLWYDPALERRVLVDDYDRYDIYEEEKIPFSTQKLDLPNRQDVERWLLQKYQ